MEDAKYYVIKKKAVPEVLLKVLEVQKLLDSKQAVSVMEAAERVGISRSSYYKYKDDIFPFYAKEKGKILPLSLRLRISRELWFPFWKFLPGIMPIF